MEYLFRVQALLWLCFGRHIECSSASAMPHSRHDLTESGRRCGTSCHRMNPRVSAAALVVFWMAIRVAGQPRRCRKLAEMAAVLQ